ncbi:arylsulfatase A family protein [Saccharomonospora marina XMU15]|uniref:Arylsulfatase A family protein n=1 Tax=Saccharomonospora marina XMU15 TaxID=882083 RepID=H5WYT9_9PSEU|nr:arylsulfatase [Saccharomonospora marina]EHR51811.1 arylsulfatase A family protein [Saccharomonospora marina XMU15]
MGDPVGEGFRGRVEVDIRDSVPDWKPFLQPQAPADAPNVLMVVWDDVGYGAMDVNGGPIETPTMRRIADAGIRYSNFHTTALCSPTRACLLTGRNATSNDMACIVEASAGFPGSSARLPFENGTIAEVLGERGWNTYALGKWHLTPGDEMDASSWKARWPLGRGFERFYGFLGAETNQWYPSLVEDNHQVDQPAQPEDGYHLSKDLADKCIRFIRDSKMVAPEKPWFTYFAPGCSHAPHHVFKDWADKYRGRFDEGYEAIRPAILARQKELGLLPDDVELSPINPHGEPDVTGPDGQRWPLMDFVRPWDSLRDDEKRLFARMAEVYAGYVSYTDHQLGRVLDYLAESGQLDNTIIVAVSDNGASAEGGPNGSVNEDKFLNGVPDTMEDNLKRIDGLGGPTTYNHYNTGWAWAFDTPFPYWKRFSGYEGGVCDTCVISWPRGISARGRVREQYIHAIDIVPTLYELTGVKAPEVLKGFPQAPIEGRSFADTITDPTAPGRTTQFYSMLGMRAVYHDGWLANTLHPPMSGWGRFDHDAWELYHLPSDRTQTRDLAAEHPDVLERLKGLWFYQAGLYKGLPLDDRTALEIGLSPRPQPSAPRDRYVYYPDTSEVPQASAVDIIRRSFGIAAGVVVDTPDAEGVLLAFGGVGGGLALFLRERRFHFVYNWLGEDIQRVSSDTEFGTGRHLFTAAFERSGGDPTGSALGTLTLYLDTDRVGGIELRTQPGPFSLSEGLSVGRDSGSPVSPDYRPPFAFTGGRIEAVAVDVSGERFVDREKEVLAYLMRD